MKPLHVAYAAIALVGTAVLLLWPKPNVPPPPSPTVTTATADGMKLTTMTDPSLVFQKAFWRRPTDDDKILHADRREWSSEDGVQKWQWFIAVRPGLQLLEYLKTNPFSLASTASACVLEKPPEWFPPASADFQTQHNAEGRFVLMLSADQKQLYATDSGSGFSPPSSAP